MHYAVYSLRIGRLAVSTRVTSADATFLPGSPLRTRLGMAPRGPALGKFAAGVYKFADPLAGWEAAGRPRREFVGPF